MAKKTEVTGTCIGKLNTDRLFEALKRAVVLTAENKYGVPVEVTGTVEVIK